MIRASDLRGRAVVDLESAVKLGEVEDVLLDPDGRRVAGLALTRGRPLLGGGTGADALVPASAVQAVGGDVVTVRGGAEPTGADLTGFPRLGQIVGRKVVTHAGAVLGPIEDVLIEPSDGRIVGYALGAGAGGGLGKLLGGPGRGEHGYVRADADLRVGPELVVVPDDAVVRSSPDERPPARRGRPEEAAPTVFGWPDPAPRPGGSSWIDQLSRAPMPGPAADAPAAPAPRARPASGEVVDRTQVIELPPDPPPGGDRPGRTA
jgi:sporulation protein YlmC with PRC-barrel domain